MRVEYWIEQMRRTGLLGGRSGMDGHLWREIVGVEEDKYDRERAGG